MKKQKDNNQETLSPAEELTFVAATAENGDIADTTADNESDDVDNNAEEDAVETDDNAKDAAADTESSTKSAIQQLKDFVDEDEERPFRFNVSIKALVGGDGLSRLIANNWCFILVTVFFTCCYVTSRYMMEKAVLENNALTDTLLDRRYKALTLNSELLEHTLSSHIESNLNDSTIHTPTDQAFPLKTK